MQDIHRKAIQRNFTSLVAQTNLEHMVEVLYEKEVFNDRLIAEYMNTNVDVLDRKRQMYTDIQRRGPRAFGHLIDALQGAGYWDLARALDPQSNLHPFHSLNRPRNRIPLNNNPEPRRNNHENNFISISSEKEKSKGKENHNYNPQGPGLDEQEGADPDSQIPKFNVIKCTKFVEGDETKLYRMRGPRRKRGVLLLFSYYKFDHNGDTFRSGADVDIRNLKYLFDELGFRVIPYDNLNRNDTIATLEALNGVLAGVECVFTVVASHGYKAAPASSDTAFRLADVDLMSVYDFLEYFNNTRLPALRGVPKVFIFQMCRGDDEGGSVSAMDARTEYDGAPWTEPGAEAGAGAAAGAGAGRAPPHLQQPQPYRRYSDMLIAHSTRPGTVSKRDTAMGSWYLTELCAVFAAHAHAQHVAELLRLVDERLDARYRDQTSSVDSWGFNRHLYLHPGLYEDDPKTN